MERRLAAILAADVVGYSRLMAADEEGTLVRLKAHRDKITDPAIAKHKGRIVKLMGDGMLAEFASIVDAVRCAIDIQEAMSEHRTDVSADWRIQLRIGINLGDIIVDGDDIYGDGVNVAARMEALSQPGGICVSGKVYQEIKSKLPITFEDLGQQEVKNIPEPVPVFRWTAAAAGPTPSEMAATRALQLPDKPSIAVLAFDNMSGDPEQEYFADGISEDIVTALSRYRSFFVSARNSSFSYKGVAVDVKRIGRELGVSYVLEGSVRRGDARIRVTAQLVETTSGNHIWAQRYDREIADLFDLQDEITRSIVTTVMPELTDAEYARAAREPPENLDAWELYQRGMWFGYRLGEADLEEAASLLRRSLTLDRNFAASWAGLAFVQQHQAAFGWGDAKLHLWGEARKSAQEAINRDEGDALAHAVMARAYAAEGKFREAITTAKRGLTHNENSSFANACLGMALVASDDAKQAIVHINAAMRLSPRDPLRWTFEVARGCALIALEQHTEALKSLNVASGYPAAGFWPFIHLAHLAVPIHDTGNRRRHLRG